MPALWNEYGSFPSAVDFRELVVVGAGGRVRQRQGDSSCALDVGVDGTRDDGIVRPRIRRWSAHGIAIRQDRTSRPLGHASRADDVRNTVFHLRHDPNLAIRLVGRTLSNRRGLHPGRDPRTDLARHSDAPLAWNIAHPQHHPHWHSALARSDARHDGDGRRRGLRHPIPSDGL